MENLDKIRKYSWLQQQGVIFCIYFLLLSCPYLVIFLVYFYFVVEGKVKSIDNKLIEISERMVPKSTVAEATVSNTIGWLVGGEKKKDACRNIKDMHAGMHACMYAHIRPFTGFTLQSAVQSPCCWSYNTRLDLQQSHFPLQQQ
uniref:Uncharacterized protein n=1 Tax=Octopus bimaculoides TaxID=37653 RepID=A0A0L8GWZ5_OCTBM